ncbi:MAG: PEP-CTERM sorting domain-containing protein [Acidobacteria bacterium]|nr:PEP-CTERM sorting domain-containing protein [Acidobacteriota bacterium]
MRRILFALVILLACAAATTGVRLQASTECERWIAEYRDALAHSPTVQRVNAARHRARHYVHRKVAALNKPKSSRPKILPARYMRPKMTREEALRKMEFACGSVDLDQPELGNLVADVPMFAAGRGPLGETGEEFAAPPSSLIAQNPTSGDGGYPNSGVPVLPYIPGAPGGGGGGGGNNPGGGGPNPPGDGGNPVPPPTGPPTAEAPEPGSLVLLATGLVAAAGVLRRRVRQA